MTGKSSAPLILTEKGVLTLYKQEFKNAVNVQVIFLACDEDYCFLRVSDGKMISPIIFLATKLRKSQLVVGAIISITETKLKMKLTDIDERMLEDFGLHRLCIIQYTLVETRETAGKLIGLTGTKPSYRESIIHIRPMIEKADDLFVPDIRWDYNSSKTLQAERDQLREHGNTLFKNKAYDEAIVFYQMALKRDPYDVRVWNNCSFAFFHINNFGAAERFAMFAIKMDPFNLKAYNRAYTAARSLEKKDNAVAYGVNAKFLCSNISEQLQEGTDLPSYKHNTAFLRLSKCLMFSEYINSSSLINTDGPYSQKPDSDYCNDWEETTRSQKNIKEKKTMNGKVSKQAQEELKRSQRKKEEDLRKRDDDERRKEELEKKRRDEPRRERDVPTGMAKLRANLNDTLLEARRLYESKQVHQTMEMITKCITLYTPETNGHNNKTVRSERPEVLTLQFILGMCKLKAGRGSVMDGIEILNSLCEDSSKFTHKASAHYLLSKTFQDINLYNLSNEHAEICNELIKKGKVTKPVRWPGGANEPITFTKPEILAEMCKELINRPIARRMPDATCRFKDCLSTQAHPYAKEEIYIKDPDFRGYVAVLCEDFCTICYHTGCWKSYKELQEDGSGRRSDKDFLGLCCMTPDCTGTIDCIKIIDENGELKNEQKKDKKAQESAKAKKKKDKKKEKVPVIKGNEKKKTRTDSIQEELPTQEETEIPAPNQTNNVAQNKPKPYPQGVAAMPLPIDPESIDPAHITVLKPTPVTEDDTIKSKKKKKNKKAKTTQHIDLYASTISTEETIQNDYMGRLRALKQQRDELEGNVAAATLISSPGVPSSLTTLQLDPENPFYLPQHLQDNPEELERVLQMKIQASNTGLKRETIDTLIQFMYDWLKEEGPMSIHDVRLREYVAEYFPPEAQTYVTQCGGIRGFLTQSLKFAMIDDIICASCDVLRAQEVMRQEVKIRMKAAGYLTRFSDGRTAKKFKHLLDDKSTCSSTSSLVAGSALSSASKKSSESTHSSSIPSVSLSGSNPSSLPISTPSSIPISTPSSAPTSTPSTLPTFTSLTHPSSSTPPLSSSVPASTPPLLSSVPASTPHLTSSVPTSITSEPNRSTPPIRSLSLTSTESHTESGETELEITNSISLSNRDSPEGNQEPQPSAPISRSVSHNSARDQDSSPQLSASSCESSEAVDLNPHATAFAPLGGLKNGHATDEEDEEIDEEEDSDSDYFPTDEEDEINEQLEQENIELKEKLDNLEEEKQALYDKLCQARSQSKSEVGSLKQKLEEMAQELKSTTAEKQSLANLLNNESRKQKNDVGRLQDEVRSNQNRYQSLQLKYELANDRINELTAKLIDEQEINAQLKEEMKTLQESLSSSTQRTHEAEVKYLSFKKDLVEENLNRTIKRLEEESNQMKTLVPYASDNTFPDRTRLAQTIMAWEETIKTLLDQKKAFLESGVKLLGMVNQGRPLNALPAGDLQIPAIPSLSVTPYISLKYDGQISQPNNLNDKKKNNQPSKQSKQLPNTTVPLPGVIDPNLAGLPLMYGPPPPLMSNPMFRAPPPFNGLPPPGPVPPGLTAPHMMPYIPPPSGVDVSCPPPGMPAPAPPPGMKAPAPPPASKPNGAIGAVKPNGATGATKPNGAIGAMKLSGATGTIRPNGATGAIAKGNTNSLQNKSSDNNSPTHYADNHSVFVGQLPWSYDEDDLKNLFSELFGEVVSAIVHEQGRKVTEGKHPKFGFVTFRYASDCAKAIASRPIVIDKHALNIQPKEPRKNTKATNTKGAGGGSEVASSGLSSAYGLSDISLDNEVSNISANATSLPLGPSSITPNTSSATMTKPNFKNLTSNPNVGAIGTLPPKLIRPQPKHTQQPPSKSGAVAAREAKEDLIAQTPSYKRLIDVCKQRLGREFTSPEICAALRDVRASNNNSLSGMSTEKIVERVRATKRGRRPIPATVAPWAGVGQGDDGPDWHGPNKEKAKEETCSICLEALASSPTVPLKCRHLFHEHCIKDWLKRQSNCPNCRKFALMTDEYPELPQA